MHSYQVPFALKHTFGKDTLDLKGSLQEGCRNQSGKVADATDMCPVVMTGPISQLIFRAGRMDSIGM